MESRNETIDAFYRGRFAVVQPKGGGHRSGADALLLAAALPCGLEGRAADLGAGAGVVGLALACRSPGLGVSLVENEPAMLDCACRSLALPVNAALSPRLSIVDADVTAPAAERRRRGLANDSFDLVATNPPFNLGGERVSPDPVRARAHAASSPDFLDCWMRAAAALLKAKGELAVILRPNGLLALLQAADRRLGAVRILPVHARADEPAIRIVCRLTKGSRAPLRLLPGFVLHRPDGAFSEEAEAVFRGDGSLPFPS